MPVAVPLIAAAAGSAVAASSIGATITLGLGLGFSGAITAGYIAGAVVSTAITAVGSRALSKKPKASNLSQDAQGRALSFRASADSHKIVYGQVKVSGPLILMHTVSDGYKPVNPPLPNKFLHYVLPLACHEVEEIGDVYLDDIKLTLDAEGFAVNAPFAREVENTVQRTVAIASAATTAYDFRTGYETVQVVTAAPHGLSVNRGIWINNTNNSLFNRQVAVASVPSPTSFTFTTYTGNSTPHSSTGGSFTVTEVVKTISSFVRVIKMLGGPGQEAEATLKAEAPTVWGGEHRGKGIAYLHVRFEKSDDAFPFGPPNVSAVVKGRKVFDPRTGLTAWSDNAALCVRDYLTARDGSALNDPYGFGIESPRIHAGSAVAAANICDEQVQKIDGTFQKRYTCNGRIDTATGRLENLTQLLTAMAGTVVEVQDQFRIHAAAYESPAMEITTAMMAGPVTMRTRTPRKDLFNAVRGVFVDPALGWQPTDFPMVTNPVYRAADYGELLTRDVELPFTTDREAAQRIAKILLEKGRQGITYEVQLMHHAVKLSVWDVVTVTNPYFGWNAKPFRVMEWSMGAGGPVMVRLQEESSASYQWNRGQAQAYDAAPDTDLPNPLVVQPPGALTVQESLYVTRSGDGVKARAMLAWGASQDPFVNRYQAEYRAIDGGAWTILPRVDGLTTDIEDISPGIYDFRVKALRNIGSSSPYSTASKQISGLSEPPVEPQNLTIATIGGLAVLRWDEYLGNANLDVKIGGYIVFRHSPDLTAGWAQTTTIGNRAPGGSTTAVLPLKPGVYLAKAVDSSGIESLGYARVQTDQATALAYANVGTLTEHSTFAGAKTNCLVIGPNLTMSGDTYFDDIADVDAVEDVDGYGGISPAASYEFSGVMDLGVVKPVRLTSHVKSSVVNIRDQIDDRSEAIDGWADFDGTDAAEGDARVMVSTTADDPAGTPTWSPYNRLDSGEFNARAFAFRLDMESRDPAYNILISELSVTADEVA